MKTTEAVTNLLSLMYTNTAWANVGDAGGLQASASPGSYQLSLHSAWPGRAGDQTTNEISYTGYGRVALNRDGSTWSVAAPQVSQISDILFGACTGGSATATHWGLGTDASGAGHLIEFGPIADAILSFVAEVAGNLITIPGHSLSVNDRIAFYAGGPDDPFPSALTEGTLYYVLTVSGDDITISATLGGTPIGITVSGSGSCAKITPLVITSSPSIQPAIAASTLILQER